MQDICRTAAKSCVHASYVHSIHSIHSVVLQAQVSSAEGAEEATSRSTKCQRQSYNTALEVRGCRFNEACMAVAQGTSTCGSKTAAKKDRQIDK